MDVVAHPADGIDFMVTVFNESDEVLVEFLAPRFVNNGIAVFHRKDKMDVYLIVSVCHFLKENPYGVLFIVYMDIFSIERKPLRGIFYCVHDYFSIKRKPLRGITPLHYPVGVPS